MKNKILVCIISYNRQPYLKTCLESLFNNTNQPFDLIIYDNDSEDPTKKLLKNFEDREWKNGCTSRVVYNKNNIGTTDIYYYVNSLRETFQYLLILGNDTKSPKNKKWLPELIDILENKLYNLDVIGLPTRSYTEILEWAQTTPISTPYGTILKIPVNISPISLYSPKFLENIKFLKTDKNNFAYESLLYNEETQISKHAKAYNLNMGYLYKEGLDDFLYFLQNNVYDEIKLYNKWKDDLKKTNVYIPFKIPKHLYGEDTSQLNIEVE